MSSEYCITMDSTPLQSNTCIKNKFGKPADNCVEFHVLGVGSALHLNSLILVTEDA